MVVLSLEAYFNLVDSVENLLDEADRAAETDSRRYTHEEVFGGIRKRINESKAANDLVDAGEVAVLERVLENEERNHVDERA
jgi:hypothetical protein